MAVYVKGMETKRELVMLTYEKLCKQDASTINIRDIAQEKGCSAAAIYRHFENLDYLIVVASVRFMHEYMSQYARLMDSHKTFVEIYVESWEILNKYAFERPDIYYRLFWGNNNQFYGDAIQDYLELFPFEVPEKNIAYFYTLIFNENMQERDMQMLRRAANYHQMTLEDADYFSQTNTLIVRGLLEDAMKMKKEQRKEAEQLCNRLIRKNMEKVLKKS